MRLTLFLTTMCVTASASAQSANECTETRLPSEREVKLAVIAPADSHHEQSLPRVLPAVVLAVKAVSSAKGLLPGWNITVDHRDSRCSSIYGPLAAFEFYINRTAGHLSLLSQSKSSRLGLLSDHPRDTVFSSPRLLVVSLSSPSPLSRNA